MEPLLVSAGTIFVLVTLVFGLSFAVRSNSIMDIWYGTIFVVVALVTYGLYGTVTEAHALVVLLVIVWGMRLSGRIFFKNLGTGKEDARYAAWREEWMAHGRWYFVVRSYLQVYILQGIIIWLVSLPVVLALADPTFAWNIFVSVGLGVWIVGFLFESVADFQLDQFLMNPENRGRVMQTGLFAYSRRPNYFGESLMWWGLAIIAFSNPLHWIAFISPAVITYIVVAVTGPITEKLWDGNEEYQAYKKRVSYFIPWFPKKAEAGYSTQ